MKINPKIFGGSGLKTQLLLSNPFDISSILDNQNQNDIKIDINNREEFQNLIEKYFFTDIPDFHSAFYIEMQLKIMNYLRDFILNTIKSFKHEKIYDLSDNLQQNFSNSLRYFSQIHDIVLDKADYLGFKFNIPILFPKGISEIEEIVLSDNLHLETKSQLMFLFPLMSSSQESSIAPSKEQRKKWKSEKIEKKYKPILQELKKLLDSDENNPQKSFFENPKFQDHLKSLNFNVEKATEFQKLQFFIYLLTIDYVCIQSCNVGRLFMLANNQFYNLIQSEEYSQQQKNDLKQFQQKYLQYFENLDIHFMVQYAEEFILKDGSKFVINGDVQVTFLYKDGKLWFQYPRDRDRIVTRVQMYSDTYCEVNREIGFYVSEGNYQEAERIMNRLRPYIAAGGATMRINREEITDLNSLGIQKSLGQDLLTNILKKFKDYQKQQQDDDDDDNNKLVQTQRQILISMLELQVQFCKLQNEQKKAVEENCMDYLNQEKNLKILIQENPENLQEIKEFFLENKDSIRFIFSMLFNIKEEHMGQDASKYQEFQKIVNNTYKNIIKLGIMYSEKHSVIFLDFLTFLSERLFHTKFKKLIQTSAIALFSYISTQDVVTLLKDHGAEHNYFYKKLLQIQGQAGSTFFPSTETKTYNLIIEKQIQKKSTLEQISEDQNHLNYTLQKLVQHLLVYEQQKNYKKHAPSFCQEYQKENFEKFELIEQDKQFECSQCNEKKEKKQNQKQYALILQKKGENQPEYTVCLACAQIQYCFKCGDTSRFFVQGDSQFDGYNCDMCLQNQRDLIPQIYCKKCDFNVCFLCMDQIRNFLSQQYYEISCKHCKNNNEEEIQKFKLSILDQSSLSCQECGMANKSKQKLPHMTCTECENNYCFNCVDNIYQNQKSFQLQQQEQQNYIRSQILSIINNQKSSLYCQQIIPITKNQIRSTIPLKLSQQKQETQYNFLQDIQFLIETLVSPVDPLLFSQQYLKTIQYPLFCSSCQKKELVPQQDYDIRCQTCRSYFGGSNELVYLCKDCYSGLCENCAVKARQNTSNKFRIKHAINMLELFDKNFGNIQKRLKFWLQNYKGIYQNLDFYRKDCGKQLRQTRYEKFLEKYAEYTDEYQTLYDIINYQQYLSIFIFMFQNQQKEQVTQQEKDLIQSFYNKIIKLFQQNIKVQWAIDQQTLEYPYIFQVYLKLLQRLHKQLQNFEIKEEDDQNNNNNNEENNDNSDKKKQNQRARIRDRSYSDSDGYEEERFESISDEDEEENRNERRGQSLFRDYSRSSSSEDENLPIKKGKNDEDQSQIDSDHLEDVRKFYFQELKSLEKNQEKIQTQDILKFFYIFKEIVKEKSQKYIGKEQLFIISKHHLNSEIFLIVEAYLQKIYEFLSQQQENNKNNDQQQQNIKIILQNFEYNIKDFLEKLVNTDRFYFNQQDTYEQENLIKQLKDLEKQKNNNDNDEKNENSFNMTKNQVNIIDKEQNQPQKQVMENYLRPFLYKIYIKLVQILKHICHNRVKPTNNILKQGDKKNNHQDLKQFIQYFSNTYLINNSINNISTTKAPNNNNKTNNNSSNESPQKKFNQLVPLQDQNRIMDNMNCFSKLLLTLENIEYFIDSISNSELNQSGKQNNSSTNSDSEEEEEEEEDDDEDNDNNEENKEKKQKKKQYILIWKKQANYQDPPTSSSYNQNPEETQEYDYIDDDDLEDADPELKFEFQNISFEEFDSLTESQTRYQMMSEVQNRILFSRQTQVRSYYNSNLWEKNIIEFAKQKGYNISKKGKQSNQEEQFLNNLFNKLSSLELPVQEFIFLYFRQYLQIIAEQSLGDTQFLDQNVVIYDFSILNDKLGVGSTKIGQNLKNSISQKNKYGHKIIDNINGFFHHRVSKQYFLREMDKQQLSQIEKIKQVYILNDLLLNYVFENPLKNENDLQQSLHQSQIHQPNQQSVQKKQRNPKLKWDDSCKNEQIEISDDGLYCKVTDSRYNFKSIIGNVGFRSGIHYWELSSDPNRNFNDIKAGVTLETDFKYGTAFSDYPFGFAIYGTELRNASNSSGNRYCQTKWPNGGTLGVCLNMVKGQLSFGVNGEYMGVAFEDEKLKKGPVYPAIAFLSQGGCTINPSAKIPKEFGVQRTGFVGQDVQEETTMSVETYNKIYTPNLLELYMNINKRILEQLSILIEQKDKNKKLPIKEINQQSAVLSKISFEFMKLIKNKDLKNTSELQTKNQYVQDYLLKIIEQYSQQIFNPYAHKSPELAQYISKILTIITEIYLENKQYETGFQQLWIILTQKLQINYNLNYLQSFYQLFYRNFLKSDNEQDKSSIENYQKANLEVKFKHQEEIYLLQKNSDSKSVICPECKTNVLKGIHGPYVSRALAWHCNICQKSHQIRDLSYHCHKCEYDCCEKCYKMKVEKQQKQKMNIEDPLIDYKLAYPLWSTEILAQLFYNEQGLKRKEFFYSISQEPQITNNMRSILDLLISHYVQESRKHLENYQQNTKKDQKQSYSLFSLFSISELLSFTIQHYPILVKDLVFQKIPINQLEKKSFHSDKQEIQLLEYLIHMTQYYQNFDLLETLLKNPYEYYEQKEDSPLKKNKIQHIKSSTDSLRQQIYYILLESFMKLLEKELQQKQQSEEQLCKVSVYLKMSHKLLENSIFYVKFHQKILNKVYEVQQNNKESKILQYLECANIDSYFDNLSANLQYYNDSLFKNKPDYIEEHKYFYYYYNQNFKKLLNSPKQSSQQDLENFTQQQQSYKFQSKKQELPKNRQNCIKIVQQYENDDRIINNKILDFDQNQKKSVTELIYNEKQIKALDLQKMPKNCLNYMKSIVSQYQWEQNFMEHNKFDRIESQKKTQLTLKEKIQISKELKKKKEWECEVCKYKNFSQINPETICLMCESIKKPEYINNKLPQKQQHNKPLQQEEEKEEQKTQDPEDKDIIFQNNNEQQQQQSQSQQDLQYHIFVSTGASLIQDNLRNQQQQQQQEEEEKSESRQEIHSESQLNQQQQQQQLQQEILNKQDSQQQQQKQEQQQQKEDDDNDDADEDDDEEGGLLEEGKNINDTILHYIDYLLNCKDLVENQTIQSDDNDNYNSSIHNLQENNFNSTQNIKSSKDLQQQENSQNNNKKLEKSLKIFEKILELRQKKQQELIQQQRKKITLKSLGDLNNNKNLLTQSTSYRPQIHMTQKEKQEFLALFNKLKKQEKIEILHLLENSFIKAVDIDLYRKADKLKRPLQLNIANEEQDYDDSDISSLPDDEQAEIDKIDNDDLGDNTSEKQQVFLYGKVEYNKEKEELYNNFDYQYMPCFSDQTIMLLIQQLILKEEVSEIQKIRGVLLHLSNNPHNAYKIYDTILFLMTLRSEDIKLLQKEDPSLFSQIFAPFYEDVNENQPSSSENNTSDNNIDKDKKFSEKKYLEKITQSFGSENLFYSQFQQINQILYKGVFSKHLSLQILENDLQLKSLQQQQQNNQNLIIHQKCQLSFTHKARTILLQHQKPENKFQDNLHCVLTIFQENVSKLEQCDIKQVFWTGILQNIVAIKLKNSNNSTSNNSTNDLDQQQNQLEEELQDSDDDKLPANEVLRRVGAAYEKTNNKNKKEQQKEVQYPQINYWELFSKNPSIFSQFCQTVQKDTQNLLIDILKSDPTQALPLVGYLFDNLTKSMSIDIDKCIEKGQNYQNEFYEKHKEKKLNKQQSLDKQYEDTELTDLCNQFWEQIDTKGLEMRLNLFRQNFRTLKQVLHKVLYPNILLYKKVEQKYDKKLKEMQEKKLEKKEKVLQKKQLNDEKQLQVNQAKKMIKKILTDRLNESEHINFFLRNFIELLYFYYNFMGEKNFNQKLHVPVLIMLQIVYELEISYAENFKLDENNHQRKNTLKSPLHPSRREGINNNINGDSENEDDDEFPDDIPMLSKLISHKQSSHMKNPSLKLKRNFSHSMKLQFDIASTFEMLFSKVYPLISGVTKMLSDETNQTRESDQQKILKDISPFFAQISLEHASQYIPINEKLEAIKKMATDRAMKNKPNTRRKEIYNEVDRCSMWSSTLKNMFLKYTPEEVVMYDLRVKFDGESGLDWGGLKNEWLTILSKEVFHPDYGLFRLSPNQKSIQPCPTAFLVPDYLTHFRMLGRLVAKAIIENWNLEVTFCKSFLKHMLNKELYIQDLEDIDQELTKNLEFLLQNDIGDGEDLFQSYTYMSSMFGKHFEVELKQEGFNELVNQSNKKEYSKAVCRARMTENIMKQTIAFKQGMTDIIPQKCLQYLSEVELQRHLSGIPSFDDNVLKQMKKYARLEGYTKNDQNIQDFFEVLESWSETMRANFLFFLTGSFKINFEGFKRNPIRITKVSSKGLPVAHTCFIQVELPEYNDKNLMKERLKISVLYGGGGGFHIV